MFPLLLPVSCRITVRSLRCILISIKESYTLFTDNISDFEAFNGSSSVCEMIDTVAKAYDGVYYDVSVNTETLKISISPECGLVTVDGFVVHLVENHIPIVYLNLP